MSKKKKASNDLKKKFLEIGDIPKELVTSNSKMVLLGNSEFTIENFKGIIEYETDKIKIKSGTGVVTVTGENLTINELGDEELFVKGKIKNIEIEENEQERIYGVTPHKYIHAELQGYDDEQDHERTTRHFDP